MTRRKRRSTCRGGMLAPARHGLTAADTVYVSMPMFHSNAIMAGWAVGLAAGAAPDGRGRSPAYVLLDAEQATALDAEISARLSR